MDESNVNVWLINTGWSGGEYGVGKRISLKYTRSMISSILREDLKNVKYTTHEVFGLNISTPVLMYLNNILHPKNTWKNKNYATRKLKNKLADAFNKNFINLTMQMKRFCLQKCTKIISK